MRYKLRNNVYCDGRSYQIGDEVSEKEAKQLGLDNCEPVGESKSENRRINTQRKPRKGGRK